MQRAPPSAVPLSFCSPAAGLVSDLFALPFALHAVGFTYELCAGIVDKPGLDLAQITKEEASPPAASLVVALAPHPQP